MNSQSQVTEVTNAKTGEKKKVSIESGHRVEWVTEENYLFKLSTFQEPLLRWLKYVIGDIGSDSNEHIYTQRLGRASSRCA